VRQVHDQIFGVEMIVPLEDLFQDDPPLLRDALAAGLKKLFEPLERREGDFNSSEREFVRHEPTKTGSESRLGGCQENQ